MRCSQPQGLPDYAEEFLRDNTVKVNQCSHCEQHDGYSKKVIGTYGMFDELKLYRYTLVDGSTTDEFIQGEIWSSGPMIWLALKWKGIDFKWPTSAIKNNDSIVESEEDRRTFDETTSMSCRPMTPRQTKFT